MHYVYVIQSPKSSELYYGFSSNLRQRIRSHRESKKHAGWNLVYYEAYRDERDARERERKLKQYGAARGHLRSRIARSTSMGLESAG